MTHPIPGADSIADDANFKRKLATYWQSSSEESRAALVETIDSYVSKARAAAKVGANVAADVRALADKWNREAIAAGFAASEDAYALYEILGDFRAAGAPVETPKPDPEAELLDMLGRIHPFAMSKADDTGGRKERITRPYVRQQPWPVPDQACIVWRADLMHICGDLTRYKAFFDSRVPAAQPSHAPIAGDVEKDAARYRWLRGAKTDIGNVIDKEFAPGSWEYRAGDELDAAIDAAMLANSSSGEAG